MKKNLLKIVIFIITALWISTINVYATTPTLDDIIASFEGNTAIQENMSSGGSYTTTKTSDTTFNITYTDTNSTSTTITYTLNGTKLSTTLNQSFTQIMAGYYSTMWLADSIGHLHGYEYGELLQTLTSDNIMNYTYENEGYQIIEHDENNYEIDIDISKKIPLMDFSDVYVTVDDLGWFSETITNDSGTFSSSKRIGNIYLYIENHNGEVTVLIAEKNNLTVNTYKSMLSILEVMFESEKAVDYFKSNYPSGFTTNKEFQGFKIEINPTKTEFESNLLTDENYKYARIKINKAEVKSALNINGNQAPADQKVNVPNTGKNTLIIGIIFGIILTSAGLGIYYYTARKQQTSN